MEVNAKLGLSDESLFLAVAIMDKFLKVVKVSLLFPLPALVNYAN